MRAFGRPEAREIQSEIRNTRVRWAEMSPPSLRIRIRTSKPEKFPD